MPQNGVPQNMSSINEQKQSTGGVLLKAVLRNFTKFTGKHLCQSLFFNQVAGLTPATLFKKETGAGVFL